VRFHLILASLAFAVNAHCNPLPPTTPVPGGVVVIPLFTIDNPLPTVSFGSQKILVVKGKHNWYGVVGISRTQTPGEYIVTAKSKKFLLTSFKFRVHARRLVNLNEQEFKQRSFKLTEEQSRRWDLEKEELEKAFGVWTKNPSVDLNLKYPVTGSLITNEGSCGFSTNIDGISFTASVGTKIRAPAAATVAAVGNYAVPGKTIILDHGQGMISLICYLNEIEVKVGQKVAKGTHLGTLGITSHTGESRADWIVMLNGSWVDPGIFIPRQ